ncbi:C39 family peptidase [Candidatus Woesearchaeota archaeon]|nr:C39 family peptidase [Candidatus Woesearchaeota archaeon]
MIPVKPFRQKQGLCGIACLKMVLEFYGLKKSERELAKLAQASAAGVNAEQLVKIVRKLRFRAQVKDFCTLSDIRYFMKRKIPVIVDWFSADEGHYSVVVRINRENIFLQDPELGQLRAMRKKTFKRVWFDFPGDFLRSKEDMVVRRMIVIKK